MVQLVGSVCMVQLVGSVCMVQLVGSVCSLMAFATDICHYAFI